jgi:hypothetical protein
MNMKMGILNLKTLFALSLGLHLLLFSLAAVKQWRFIPAKEGENIISVWVNIPVKFQLQ